jgi:hypothetical protein
VGIQVPSTVGLKGKFLASDFAKLFEIFFLLFMKKVRGKLREEHRFRENAKNVFSYHQCPTLSSRPLEMELSIYSFFISHVRIAVESEFEGQLRPNFY